MQCLAPETASKGQLFFKNAILAKHEPFSQQIGSHINHGAKYGETFFFLGVSWCGATSMTDMTMIFYFPHLWSWRKLQNKKFWNFDLFWMICGATCVEKWPICRILWRNVFFFWGQKSGEKVKNGIFCLFQIRVLWSFYKWYSYFCDVLSKF